MAPAKYLTNISACLAHGWRPRWSNLAISNLRLYLLKIFNYELLVPRVPPQIAGKIKVMTSRKIDNIVNETQRNVASNLIALREGASLTQLQLSELAGIDRKTINRIENGHFLPSVDTLTRLALVLNTTVGNLLDD